MNQPIDESRIRRLEQRVDRVEQLTEPIKVTRIELDPGRIQTRLDNHAEMMKEQDKFLTDIYTNVGHMKGDIATLKTDMSKVQADIIAIKDSQADFRDRQKEHGERLTRVETTMATKDDIKRIEMAQAEQGKMLREILALVKGDVKMDGRFLSWQFNRIMFISS
jgi:chromosome segregation ATPase